MAPIKKRVNTVEAKNRLNELIAQTRSTREPVIVERRGEPVAAVVDYESYQRQWGDTTQRSDERFFSELLSFHRSLRKKYPQGTGDSIEILREIRRERESR